MDEEGGREGKSEALWWGKEWTVKEGREGERKE